MNRNELRRYQELRDRKQAERDALLQEISDLHQEKSPRPKKRTQASYRAEGVGHNLRAARRSAARRRLS